MRRSWSARTTVGPRCATLDGMVTDDIDSLVANGEAGWPPFLERYADVVYRAAGRATSDQDEARTIAVDVLERLRADWPEVLKRFIATSRGERASFPVWLAVVARRLAIDCLRARYGRRSVPAVVRRGEPWLRRAWRLSIVEQRPTDEVWDSLKGLAGVPGSPGELDLALEPLRGPTTPTGAARMQLRSLGDMQPETPERTDPLSAENARSQLSKVLAGLPGDDRVLLRLYFLEGTSADALRRLHGSSTRSQVYNRIHNLLRRIRVQLEAHGLSMDDLGNPREVDLGEWLSFSEIAGDSPEKDEHR